MSETPFWRRYLRLLGSNPAADVQDELDFHFAMRVEDLMKRGLSEPQARAQAEREFGDVDRIRRELNEVGERRRQRETRARGWEWLGQDLRFGVRSALRAPLFTFLAIVTLALGIGANAAVFGVVKSVLLDALPYGDADRLVRVYGRFLEDAQDRGALSAGMIDDIRQRQQSFSGISAFMGYTPEAIYGGADGPSLGKVAWVEPSLFRTLGVTPPLGRAFLDEDAEADTAGVVLLTHAAWKRLLGGETGALGREVLINGIPRTVIGVLPEGFVSPTDAEPDFFLPFSLQPTLDNPISIRRSHWLGAVGRLKPGVTQVAAHRELTALSEDLAVQYPEDNGSIRVIGMALRDAMVGDTRTPLLVLLASAGLVLLIACANLAGAMLSRTISRRKEFAVRVALGAGRGRLVRQLLTESTLLAVAGGAAGLLLAGLVLSALRGLAPPGALPAYAELSLDGGAVVVTAVLALVTGLLFGVAPALSVGRAHPQGTLREESRGSSESVRSRRLRGVLVAGQIALCVSLLAGAGLLVRSLLAMTTAPPGYDPAGVLTVAVHLPNSTYPTVESRVLFEQQFLERLGALPGVSSTASGSSVPTTVMSSNGIAIEGAPPTPADAQPFVLIAAVSDDYFRTLRIPLRQGRTFGPQDALGAPPTLVVSEAMARRYWPDGDAIGARLRMGPDPQAPMMEVVGVVGDVRNDPARPDPEPMMYSPSRQGPWSPAMFLVRTESDPSSLVSPIRRELAELDPGLPLDPPVTLRAVLSDGLAGRRLPVLLMSAFGVLALLLASVGVYALFASMAAAREREFGVRMALGSRRSAIAALVLRQGAVWMVVGLVGGAVGVVLVTRLLGDLLYGVSRFDPVALGVAVATLLLCATVALLAPVRRATRVDPATALRAQ